MTQPAAPAAPVDYTKTPPEAEQVNAFHRYSDKDVSQESDHHTLGTGIEQASPGDHNHDGKNSKTLATNSHNHSGLVTADTAWHEIGTAGEPAFQNAWLNYDTTFNSAAFRKTVDGTVLLKGLIRSGTPAAIFILPVGYRPLKQYLFIGWSVNSSARIDVLSGGTVLLVVYDTGGSNAFVSLDNIQFYAEQ